MKKGFTAHVVGCGLALVCIRITSTVLTGGADGEQNILFFRTFLTNDAF